jgi:YD repeat-containing protein
VTDRERWDLRGAVKRMEVQRVWYAPQCSGDQCAPGERGAVNRVEFRRDGALVGHVWRNPDGSEHTARYEYDSADRLVRLTFTGSRSEVRIDYEYDERGNWIHKTVLARNTADRDFVTTTVEQRTIAYYDG